MSKAFCFLSISIYLAVGAAAFRNFNRRKGNFLSGGIILTLRQLYVKLIFSHQYKQVVLFSFSALSDSAENPQHLVFFRNETFTLLLFSFIALLFVVYFQQKLTSNLLHFNQKVEVDFFAEKLLIFFRICCIITLQSREIAKQKRTAKVRLNLRFLHYNVFFIFSPFKSTRKNSGCF